jgi:hypothetical protein
MSDALLALVMFSVLLSTWVACCNQFQKEESVLSLCWKDVDVEQQADVDERILVLDGSNTKQRASEEPIIESHQRQEGGPSWLRINKSDSRVWPVDRVISIELPARALPNATPLTYLRSAHIFHEASAGQLNALAQFPHLEALSLFAVSPLEPPQLAAGVEDHRLEFPAMPYLRGLSLSNSKISGLSKLKSLEVLEMTGDEFDDDDVNELRALTNLRMLSLEETNISGASLRYLAGLTHLEKLVLNETEIDDLSLKHLAALGKLEYLSLDRTNVSGAGLHHLVRLPKLKALHLASTHVTRDDIELLAQFPALRSLSIDSQSFSKADVQNAKNQLRNCDVFVFPPS